MPYENSAGLGVNNFYGPRVAGGAQGPDVSSGVLNQFVWFFNSTALINNRFPIPAGSLILDVTRPAGVTAITVGGTAVQAATWAVPIVAGGAVAVTGAVTGDKVVITYQKVVGALPAA